MKPLQVLASMSIVVTLAAIDAASEIGPVGGDFG